MNHISHTFQSFVNGVSPALGQRDIPSVSFHKPMMNLIKSTTSYPSKLYFHTFFTSFILLSESIFYYWMTLEAFYLLIPTITLKRGKLYRKQWWRPWIELVFRYQKAAQPLKRKIKYIYILDRQHAGFIFNIDSLNFDSVCIWILEMSWHISWKVTFSPFMRKGYDSNFRHHIWFVPHS